MSENASPLDNGTAPITAFRGAHRFLSNFWTNRATGITWKGMTAISTEHLFQAAKARNIADRRTILATASPGAAKKLGREVTMRSDWDSVRLEAMASIQAAKYSDPELRALLLATGDAELLEGNEWGDTFWGVDLATLQGKNHLGKILMALREELREEDAEQVWLESGTA